MMYLYTEAFYYLADHTQSILRNKRRVLPAVREFKTCRPITIIRNHLLEHAHGTYPVRGEKAQWGSVDGPALTIRPFPRQPDHLIDKGLFVNARALHRSALPVLAAAVSTLPEGEGSQCPPAK
jgi:hypothetical protein